MHHIALDDLVDGWEQAFARETSVIGGVALVLAGGVFFYAGAANFCLIEEPIRAPFRGRDVRA